MLYSAIDIAHYIIDKCTKDNCPISNLQLQKILYFAQGEFYKKYHAPLFGDDIQAWQYGPVIPEVYNEFSSNGAATICDLFDTKIDAETCNKLDPIIEKYRKESVWSLVERSHVKGGPWDTVYKGYKVVIPKKLIEGYFCKKV